MSLASYKQIVDLVANRLTVVPNVGIVHKYLRQIIDPKAFDELCFDRAQNRIAAWFITRESISEELLTTNQETQIKSSFVLLGYLGLKDADATELMFQQVIDDIREAFRPTDSLDDVVELRFMVQARTIDADPIHGVLCHRAQLALEVQEFYTP